MVTELTRPVDRAQLDQEIEDFNLSYPVNVDDAVNLFTRDEKTDLPNVKGEVKRAIKATFAHLCTTFTRDKCLPLLAVKAESSGDKGRFLSRL